MTYEINGTCAKAVDFEIEDGIIKSCNFMGGCPGNTQGVARLAEGRRVEEVIAILEGIQCGNKGTSCPDQLAKCLREAAGE